MWNIFTVNFRYKPATFVTIGNLCCRLYYYPIWCYCIKYYCWGGRWTYWLEFFHRSSPPSTGSHIPRWHPFACQRKPDHLDSRTAQADHPRIPNNGRSKPHPVPPYFWLYMGLPVRWMTSVVADRSLKTKHCGQYEIVFLVIKLTT